MSPALARRSLLVLLVVLAAFSMGQSCGPSPLAPAAVGADADNDLVPDWADNCVDVPNRSQRNSTISATEVCTGSDPQPDKSSLTPAVFGTCANDGSACLLDVDCHRGDACDCDFNGDGQCNIDDFNIFVADHGSGLPAGTGTDMNEDGIVDDLDFTIFEPLFAAGSAGPGASPARVALATDTSNPVEGACFDAKWSRMVYASSGRNSGSALACSVASNSALAFLLTPNQQQALVDDPDNPTNAIMNLRGFGSNECPSAAFSSGDKTNALACDAHDLCGSRCGRIAANCDAQFYRDLFHTCDALSGSERTVCRLDCLEFAKFYSTAIATGNSSIPDIVTAPDRPDTTLHSADDLKQDELNCLCTPPVCRTNSDCTEQNDLGATVACDAGYCVQKVGGQNCTADSQCPNGYRCDGGDCLWDVTSLPDRLALDLPPPVCGDGICEPGLESCQVNSCPEDCAGAASWDGQGGSCGFGDSCEMYRDCGEGVCFESICQLLPNGLSCLGGEECASDSCGSTTDTCSATCLFDIECGSGVCHLLQCVQPLPSGTVCDANTDCASGLCAGVCLAAAVQDPGDLCILDGQCKSGICTAGFCQGTCGDGFCTLVPNGETCFVEGCQADCGACPTATPGCDEDADCAGGLCGGGVCLDRATTVPGGICLFDAECTSGTCTAGLCAGSCGDGFCTLLPDAEGCLSCSTDCGMCPGGTFGCILDSQCASNDCRGGFCGGIPNGNACLSNSLCASGVCNVAVCVNADSVGLGGICTTSLACASDQCTAGLCVCDGNSDCSGSKICVAGACVSPPPSCLSNGTTCLFDSNCCSDDCGGFPPKCR